MFGRLLWSETPPEVKALAKMRKEAGTLNLSEEPIAVECATREEHARNWQLLFSKMTSDLTVPVDQVEELVSEGEAMQVGLVHFRNIQKGLEKLKKCYMTFFTH